MLYIHTVQCLPATSKKKTPPSGDTVEHHFSQRAGKLFQSNRTTETNTHLQQMRHRNTSREQQQRNINSDTKTQIFAHKMRHMTRKRSATRAANGMAFHKTADEWQRLTHFSVAEQILNWPNALSLTTRFCFPMSTVVRTSVVVSCSSSLGSHRRWRTWAAPSHPWAP